MKFNEKNVVVSNVLTAEEIGQVHESILETESSNHHQELGYYTWHLKMPKNIEEKFLKIAEDICGEKLVLSEYNASKYHLSISDDGSELHPLLFPHTDEAFYEERFTLDYQLESNITWPIIIKSDTGISEIVLSDNEAGTFSGTHQVHWRPKRIFTSNEFMTLVFMHFKKASGAKTLSLDHINSMRKIAKEEYDKWIEQDGRSNNKLYDPKNEPRYMNKEKL